MTGMKGDKFAIRRIPKCLRYASIWFVTEPRGDPGSMSFVPYSAVTLAPLRYDRPEDYIILDWAVEAFETHLHWLDGCGFRVRNVWKVLVIQNCLTPAGNVTGGVREVIRRLGGFWESTRDGKSIQGILWSPQRQDSRGGVIAGHPAYLCSEGVCGVTGNGVPGFMGDPMQTYQDVFSAVIREMATAPRVAFRQLPLF